MKSFLSLQVLALLLSTLKCHSKGQRQIFGTLQKIADNSPLLKIQSWNIASNYPDIKFEFSPQLTVGVDYEIVPPEKYKFPDRFNFHNQKNNSEVITLKLLPNKRWISSKENTSQYSYIPLYVTKLYIHNNPISLGQTPTGGETKVLVAKVSPREMRHTNTCPSFTSPERVMLGEDPQGRSIVLPGVRENLLSFLSSALVNCPAVRIFPSRRLPTALRPISRRGGGESLLNLSPGLVLVNGSDQSLGSAARAVDVFLAPRAVLQVGWEPFSKEEPRWWVLLTRPKGMPGHLFAMFDALQWRHPLVSRPREYYRRRKNCTTDEKGITHCEPGCPGTKIRRFFSSGYNADTDTVSGKLREALVLNQPFQLAPLRLNPRLTPPLWDGTIGWTYTFGACPSHFVDCVFIDHSPCPPINIEVHHGPNNGYVDPNRKGDPIFNFEDNADWYREAVGSRWFVPRHAVGGLVFGLPARHVAYTYLFRPLYKIRQEVHRRVSHMSVEKDSCALIHVRRGDIILHPWQGGRAYIPITAYVQAAKPFLEKMNLHIIVLLTDSEGAIEEAMRCEIDYPDLCAGLEWKFISKKRWRAAEGGWENPFPSGNATEEFLFIQSELSLAQQCSIAVLGNSGYGDLVYRHMCCGFPGQPRGNLPSRCLCPPLINLEQAEFNCKTGNIIACDNKDVGGNMMRSLDDPSNTLGRNFSFTKAVYRSDPKIRYSYPVETMQFRLSNLQNKEVKLMKNIDKFVAAGIKNVCEIRAMKKEAKPIYC